MKLRYNINMEVAWHLASRLWIEQAKTCRTGQDGSCCRDLGSASPVFARDVPDAAGNAGRKAGVGFCERLREKGTGRGVALDDAD
jgi:hypothetical protein